MTSAIDNSARKTLVSIPSATHISNQLTDSSPRMTAPSPPNNEDDHNQNELNPKITHAYRIPQQSNVGSESVLPLHSSAVSSITVNSTKKDHRHSYNKSISYPFYMMYFSKLAKQQQQHSNDDNEQKAMSTSMSNTKMYKQPFNLHRSSSIVRCQSTKKNVKSTMNASKHSNSNNNDHFMANRTPYYSSKHFSAKMIAFENENSYLLKDVLRTTSWNHVKV